MQHIRVSLISFYTPVSFCFFTAERSIHPIRNIFTMVMSVTAVMGFIELLHEDHVQRWFLTKISQILEKCSKPVYVNILWLGKWSKNVHEPDCSATKSPSCFINRWNSSVLALIHTVSAVQSVCQMKILNNPVACLHKPNGLETKRKHPSRGQLRHLRFSIICFRFLSLPWDYFQWSMKIPVT